MASAPPAGGDLPTLNKQGDVIEASKAMRRKLPNESGFFSICDYHKYCLSCRVSIKTTIET